MLEDGEIIKLYNSGRQDAAELLVERYKVSLYRFCRHLTLNTADADDLFQDTWVKAVGKLTNFDSSKNFKTWLFSIALNTYRDGYRKAKRWLSRMVWFFSGDSSGEIPDTVSAAALPVPEEAEEKELRMILKKCVDSLDDTFRIPLILFYFKQFSYDQISEILAIPVGTVKSRLSTARNKLKKQLEVKGYGG